MKLYIHNMSHKQKPDMIGYISSSILNDKVDVTIGEFAHEVAVKGKTTILCELSEKVMSKETPIISQELVMLDFDNKGDKKYTIKDFLKDPFMINYASFYYKTFSDEKSEDDKFRVVFQLDKPLTDNYEVELLYAKLFSLYPQSDQSVGQTTRMFFGSNRGIEEVNFKNRLMTKEITPKYGFVAPIKTSEIVDESTPNYLLLKYRKEDIVRKKLGEKFSQIFPDDASASNYFKLIDMVDFLELPEGNPFLDILHEEDNPSASVYLCKKSEIYLYKCFSESNSFQGDIIRVLQKLLGISSASKIIDLLIYISNSEIDHSTQLGAVKRDFANFTKELKNKQFEANYPELHSYVERYKFEIEIILDMMFDYMYIDKRTKEIQYMTYVSLDSITKTVNYNLPKGQKVSSRKVWDIMNLIVVTEMVTKLPVHDIPQELLDTVINKQINNPDQIRTSNVYTPTMDIVKSSDIAKKLRDNNVTVRSLSFDLIYRNFGEEKAYKDFPQAYNKTDSIKFAKMSDKDNNLTDKSVKFEDTVVKILMKEVEKNNYMYENDLIEKVARRTKKSNANTLDLYQKIRSDVMNKYGLTRKRQTKEIHNKFKIKSPYSPKTIIYK